MLMTMERYSEITAKMPREFVLLQGTGCHWRRCVFCDYYEDVSNEPFLVNEPVLQKVTGKYGVLDIINSGSCTEFDPKTLEMLRQTIEEKNISTVWFEAHYMYRHRLGEFARLFAPATVKFRCGVETFDPTLRKLWNKGIPENVTAEDAAKYFQGVCLLCCTDGDTKERIMTDIALADKYFQYFSVNVFCPNNTPLKRDELLAEWFRKEICPALNANPKAEVLLENTDLGVG